MRYEVEFEYADSLSNWEWRKQQCSMYADNEHQAVDKTKNLYGLDFDCEYRILSVKGESQ